MNNEFKINNREILRKFYDLYTKFSGQIPLLKLREFIFESELNLKEKNQLIDILINDKMISFSSEDIFDDIQESEIDDELFDDEIIDDIDVSIQLKPHPEQTTFLKKKLTVEDENELFDFFAKKVRENEYEYFSIPELINVMLDSQAYAKTYEVKEFIKLFVDVLEDNF